LSTELEELGAGLGVDLAVGEIFEENILILTIIASYALIFEMLFEEYKKICLALGEVVQLMEGIPLYGL